MKWSYENIKTNRTNSSNNKGAFINLWNNKKWKINRYTSTGIVSISGLAILLLALFVLPLLSASKPTHAATPIEPTISIIPASGITMDMTPAGGTAGSFGTATASVTVNSTNVSGYTLTMNTETTDPDLKNSKIDYTDPTKADLKITNLTTSTTESNFSPNKWGYNVSKSGTYLKGANGTYVPVPNSGSSTADKQIEATTAAGNGTYTFTYGVKANNNLPAGAYNNTIVYSATGNEVPLISMQEATYADCGGNMYDDRGTDAYKSIEYTTANIKGLCWMTRNLDLPGGTTLTTSDSNVASSYNLPASSTEGFSSNTAQNVYNSGSTSCSSSSACYSYYTWRAATSNKTSSTDGASVAYDICPKGWRLPTKDESTTLQSSYTTSAAMVGSPFLGVYNGIYSSSALSYGGARTIYWTSTANSSTKGYGLYLRSGYASAVDGYARKYGGAVRCVKEGGNSLTINFAGTGVSSVKVCSTSGDCSGDNLIGTVSHSGNHVSGLTSGSSYYLYPSFSGGYELDNWAKTSGEGTLSSTSAINPTFTVGNGNGTITITGKEKPTVYMWDATYADCGATMLDNRDGTERSYTTAEINDLCWMTTNLSLGKSTTTALTSATSNVSSSGYTLPASSTSGFIDATAENVYNSGSTTCSSTSACYAYYTWKAATAGSTKSTDGENADYDICPKGWRLPTQAELDTLKSSYSTGAKLVAAPFLGVYAGYYDSSQLVSGGSNGLYWSSTAYSSTVIYGLAFSSSSVLVTNYAKRWGEAVRCVKEPTM